MATSEVASSKIDDDSFFFVRCDECDKLAVGVTCNVGHEVIIPCFLNPGECQRALDDSFRACKYCTTIIKVFSVPRNEAMWAVVVEHLKALNEEDNAADDEDASLVGLDPSAEIVRTLTISEDQTKDSPPTSGPSSDPSSDLTSISTSGPTSGPTSRPSSDPSSDLTSGPTSGPASDPTSGPSSDPSSDLTSGSTSGPTSGPTSRPIPTNSSIDCEHASSQSGKPNLHREPKPISAVHSPPTSNPIPTGSSTDCEQASGQSEKPNLHRKLERVSADHPNSRPIPTVTVSDYGQASSQSDKPNLHQEPKSVSAGRKMSYKEMNGKILHVKETLRLATIEKRALNMLDVMAIIDCLVAIMWRLFEKGLPICPRRGKKKPFVVTENAIEKLAELEKAVEDWKRGSQ